MSLKRYKKYSPGDIYLVYISHKEIYASMKDKSDFVYPFYDVLCFMDVGTDFPLMEMKIYLN